MKIKGIMLKNHTYTTKILDTKNFDKEKNIKINNFEYCLLMKSENNTKLSAISFPDTNEQHIEHIYGDFFICKKVNEKYHNLSAKDIIVITKNIVESAYTASKKFPMSKKVLLFNY